MAKFIHVTMPDGSVWAVPARPIAERRAAYYAQVDTGKTSGCEYDKACADEVEYALGDEGELIDYAMNSMNWDDVKEHAVQVRSPVAPDYHDGWVNGEKRVVETVD